MTDALVAPGPPVRQRAMCGPVVVHYLNSVVSGLLAGSYRESVGRQLFAAVARLTELAGYMAVDTGQPGPRPALLHPGAAPRPGGRRPGIRRLCPGRVHEPPRRPARQPARDRPTGAGRAGGRARAGHPAGRGDVPRGRGARARAARRRARPARRWRAGRSPRWTQRRRGLRRRPELDRALRPGLSGGRAGPLSPGPGPGGGRRATGRGVPGRAPRVAGPAARHRARPAGHARRSSSARSRRRARRARGRWSSWARCAPTGARTTWRTSSSAWSRSGTSPRCGSSGRAWRSRRPERGAS